MPDTSRHTEPVQPLAGHPDEDAAVLDATAAEGIAVAGPTERSAAAGYPTYAVEDEEPGGSAEGA